MGVQFAPEYQKFYKNRFADVVHGQLRNRSKYENAERWLAGARTSMFRTGLKQIENDQQNGQWYNLTFDFNAMDD